MLVENQPKQHTSQIHTAVHAAIITHISNSKLLDLFGVLVAGTVAIAFVMSRASHGSTNGSPYVVSHSVNEEEVKAIPRSDADIPEDKPDDKPTSEGIKSSVFYDCLRGPGIFLKRIKAERAEIITLKLNDTFELCWAKKGTTLPASIATHRYHLSTLLAAFKCDGGLVNGSRFVLQFPSNVLCVDAETSDKADFVIEGLLSLRLELTGRTLAFVHALKRSSSSSSSKSWKAELNAAEANDSRTKSSRFNRLVEQLRWTMKRRSSGREIKVVEPQPKNYAQGDISWE